MPKYNFSLRFLPVAEEDLNGIFDYIAINLNAPEAAEKLILKILREASGLSQFPCVGEIVKDEEYAKKEFARGMSIISS